MIPALPGNVTDRTRKVLRIAHDLATHLGHDDVSPEHIAIALLREGAGVAVAVLLNWGVPIDSLERELEAQLSPSGSLGEEAREISWTPASTRVLDQARVESLDLGHPYIGTEHLFLGLLRDSAGAPARVLARYGLGLHDARTGVMKVLTAGYE
jgi:ATP-dependent Clp protease ATP-binding subunit ClpC